MQGGHSPVVVSHAVLPSLRQDVTELQKSLVSEAVVTVTSSARAVSALRPAVIASSVPLFLCPRTEPNLPPSSTWPEAAEPSGQTHRTSRRHSALPPDQTAWHRCFCFKLRGIQAAIQVRVEDRPRHLIVAM